MPRLFPPEFYEDSESLLPNNFPKQNSQNLKFSKHNLSDQNFSTSNFQVPNKIPNPNSDNSQISNSKNNSKKQSFHDLAKISSYKKQSRNNEMINSSLENEQNLNLQKNFGSNFQNSNKNSNFQNNSRKIFQNKFGFGIFEPSSQTEKQTENVKYLTNPKPSFTNSKRNKRNFEPNNFGNHSKSNGNLGSGNQRNQNSFGNWKIIVVVFLAISLVSLGVLTFYSDSNFPNSTNSSRFTAQKLTNYDNQNVDLSQNSSQNKIIKPKNLSLKMLFLGNTFWGRYIDDWSKASDLKEKYPFSGLSTLDKSKYDAWISGLECPITTTYRSSVLQDSDLKFSCPPEYTAEAAKWFEAFTLANNHTDNMEEVDGFAQTRKFLGENGIQSFGHFDSEKVEELCKVVSFPARDLAKIENPSENSEIQNKNSSQKSNSNSQNSQKYQIPVALCGYHNVFKLPTDSQLAQITEYSKYLPTIVMPHGGAEYTTKADQIKTSLYRQMIELGADAVIGDHPHSVQNTEVWQDKLIVYSLGNFLFDQQASITVRQSLAIDGEMSLEFDENLEKWTELAKICKNQNLGVEKNEVEKNSGNKVENFTSQKSQNCLEIAKSQNLQKPKAVFIWNALATDSTGKITQKANSQITQNVLAIANWTQTKKELESLEKSEK